MPSPTLVVLVQPSRCESSCVRGCTPLIAELRVLEADVPGRARLAAGVEDRVGELVDGRLLTAPDIENCSQSVRCIQCMHPRVDDVVDEDEVPRLQPVPVNGDRLATEDVADEDREDALVRVRDALARTEDVEHPAARSRRDRGPGDPLRSARSARPRTWSRRSTRPVCTGRPRESGCDRARRRRSSSSHGASLGTPDSMQPRKTLTVPSTFVARSVSGRANESLMLACPATWNTESKCSFANTSATSSPSATSPSTNDAAAGTRSRTPVVRLSSTVTAKPSARRRSARCDPMKPAPPVTRARLTRSDAPARRGFRRA